MEQLCHISSAIFKFLKPIKIWPTFSIVMSGRFQMIFRAHLFHSVRLCIHFIFIRDNKRLASCLLFCLNFADFIPKFDLNLPTAVWVCRQNVNSECQNNGVKILFSISFVLFNQQLCFSFGKDLAGIGLFFILWDNFVNKYFTPSPRYLSQMQYFQIFLEYL